GNDNTYSIVSQKEGRSHAVTYVPIETYFTLEPYIEDKMEQKFRIESQNGSSPVAISIKEQTLYATADQEKGFAEGSRIVPGTVNKKQWNLSSYISQIFYGTLIHSLSLTELKIIFNAVLGVDNCGKIAFLEPNVSNEQTLCDIIKRWGSTKDKHAPQYPNAGTGMDLPLLDWLNKYTYPLEKKFSSIEFAKKIYPIVVNQLLRCGTTTAVYYATIHLESSKYLADVVQQKGQRGFIGKVNMDRNNPHDYVETMESSVRDTVQFVKYIQSLESSLITPIITPRSVLSCTPDLLKSLGDISKDFQIPIQSHLSENLAEIDS
ncbi:10682_t:CDS:2, partial [Racocetra fulgida]